MAWIKVTHVTSCWRQETKKIPPTKLYANMQLPSMSFANIISEQTFFFLYRYDRVLTYDICSTMIVFYHQTKISINFLCKRDSNFEFFN